jgi:hypothetical protein
LSVLILALVATIAVVTIAYLVTNSFWLALVLFVILGGLEAWGLIAQLYWEDYKEDRKFRGPSDN